MLIQFMEKKERWASYAIDRVKGTCGLRGSSMSESNHSTINKFVLKNIEGIHGLMLQLIKCQKQTNDDQSWNYNKRIFIFSDNLSIIL